MDLDEFFERVVDGYLFGDLRTMETAEPEGPYGGVGYPILGTALAGMELLGFILTPGDDDHENDNLYFLNYWNNYFVVEHSIYAGLGPLFRRVVRHGVAHTFIAKGNVLVERRGDRQIEVNKEEQKLAIDCLTFCADFRTSYEVQVKPLLDGSPGATTKEEIAGRISQLLLKDGRKAASAFSELSDGLPSLVKTFTYPLESLSSGPAGAIGPTGASGLTGGTIGTSSSWPPKPP